MSKPVQIDQEDTKLSAAGFDPALPPAEALAKLRELRETGAISETSIARGLGRILDVAAAAMLAQMEENAGGALRREIRRSLYKLRQRGIHPAPPQPSAGPAHSEESAGASMIGLFSPIDAEGARVVWIAKPRAQGGLQRLWGLVDEETGLVGCLSASLSRNEFREERQELERRAEMQLVEGDWHLADFILCEAYRHTPESRRARVGNFLVMRAEIIAAPPPTEIAHPIYPALAAEAAGDPSLDLFKEPEMVGCRVPASAMAPYLEELKRANESTIVLNQMQQRDRIDQIVERAVGELFTGEAGTRLRRRLEDTAYYLLKSGRRKQAGWAAAAAARLRDGKDLKHEKFFHDLVAAQLVNVAAEEREQMSDEPRLIMTPAEAMRASQAARQRRLG